jgi:hypothetical protein
MRRDKAPRKPAQLRSWGQIFCVNMALALCAFMASSQPAPAQTAEDRVANSAWQGRAIGHAQAMRRFRDADAGAQATLHVIPRFGIDFDPTGLVATDQPNGSTITSTNAFFQDLGTNRRSCFTCHQPQTGWTVSAQSVQGRFYASFGSDPIFRLVDGATCPTDDVSNLPAKLDAYSLLLRKGLIRVGLAIPSGAEYEILSVSDPYHCTTNPTTGLTSPISGIVSVYRRPLPTTNLSFLTSIMWDGREPSLESVDVDATLIHAQAASAPTVAQ